MVELKHRTIALVNTVNLYSITRARSLRSLAYRPLHTVKHCKGIELRTSDCVFMRRVPIPLASTRADSKARAV